jgi:hypothetical protein
MSMRNVWPYEEDSYFINTPAAASSIKSPDQVLQEQRIAGAGLDVSSGPTDPDDPLLNSTTLSSHRIPCWTDSASPIGAAMKAVLTSSMAWCRAARQQEVLDSPVSRRVWKTTGAASAPDNVRNGRKQWLQDGNWLDRHSATSRSLAQPAWAKGAESVGSQYRGQTITIVWEAGLQALDPLNFSGPKWKELTGIDVKVIEVSTAEMFTKIMQDYKSGAGAYDALNVIPAWMPDLANAGALEPLDAYVDKYGFRDELQMIAPTYRDNQMTVDGKIFGFPDDGDVFLFYYRKDIFADAAVQAAFKEKTGKDLAVPKTWADFAEVGQFLTDHLKGKGIYGAVSPARRPMPCSCTRSASQRGRQVLRCRHNEGRHQLRHRRQGAHRDARGEQVHAAGR